MRFFPVVALSLALLTSTARAQPAHPAARYSCMSEPSDGSAWPTVEAGVPPAIEAQHPGYAIAPFRSFTVPGLALFIIRGGLRRAGAPERYASVEAVDQAGAVLTGRGLFVRAAATTTNAAQLAQYAMSFLLRRADERPLTPGATAGLRAETVPHVAAPHVQTGTLRFWVRADSTSPYASEVRVELATGVHQGDVW